MIDRSFRVAFTRSLITAAIAAAPASAQCLDWNPAFKSVPGATNGEILAALPFDDGSGLALYVGGLFTTAGGRPANRIARWDGEKFVSLSTGANDRVSALAVFDDGSGPALYAGGEFTSIGGSAANHVAKWNGSSWSALGLGTGGRVLSLAVFDDGSGAALYVGGDFTTAGGSPASYVARWNGSSWSALDLGANDRVAALAVYDDGGGSALYASGFFTTAGEVPANRIAKWNGSSWSALGQGLASPGFGHALAVFDDGPGGNGPALIAAGSFQLAGGQLIKNVARWDGEEWSALGAGTNGTVHSLHVFDDGGGPALFAAGSFSSAGGVPCLRIARWNGASWSPLAGGVGEPNAGHRVMAMSTFDSGSGEALVAAGVFLGFDATAAPNVAQWDGSAWSSLGATSGVQGMTGTVHALAVADDGDGPKLYAGGSFKAAGVTWAEGIARRDGSSWTRIGGGHLNGEVRAVLGFDDGSGWKLYAAGDFSQIDHSSMGNIARWDGSDWSPMGGLNEPAHVLAVFDDGGGSALYVGGEFAFSGATYLGGIGRWTGTSFAPLGAGMNGAVNALAVYDGGAGKRLVAGGVFTTAGGTSAPYVAQWNGTSWAALGGGALNGLVAAACVFDDGGGSALYVGGTFTLAGAVQANRVARWDGATWSAVGSGFDDGAVLSLCVFDEGGGSALYAGGAFNSSGGSTVRSIAKWTGTNWVALGAGISAELSTVRAMAALANSGGGGVPPDLFVGGTFGAAGATDSSNLAHWRSCESPIDSFCFGDGTVAGCPCGNTGLAGHGCDNSAATGGARLAAVGTPSPDALVLGASGELPNALSIFLQGDALVSASAPFGDGLRCAGGHLLRLFTRNAVNGTVEVPQGGDPSISARSAALGDPLTPGETRYYQTYYRDPNLAFCPTPQGNSWNVTNGVRVVW